MLDDRLHPYNIPYTYVGVICKQLAYRHKLGLQPGRRLQQGNSVHEESINDAV